MVDGLRARRPADLLTLELRVELLPGRSEATPGLTDPLTPADRADLLDNVAPLGTRYKRPKAIAAGLAGHADLLTPPPPWRSGAMLRCRRARRPADLLTPANVRPRHFAFAGRRARRPADLLTLDQALGVPPVRSSPPGSPIR